MDLNNILDAVQPFLSNEHHRLLQTECVKFLIKLAKTEAPTVYVKLINFQMEDKFKENIGIIYNEIS